MSNRDAIEQALAGSNSPLGSFLWRWAYVEALTAATPSRSREHQSKPWEIARQLEGLHRLIAMFPAWTSQLPIIFI